MHASAPLVWTRAALRHLAPPCATTHAFMSSMIDWGTRLLKRKLTKREPHASPTVVRSHCVCVVNEQRAL